MLWDADAVVAHQQTAEPAMFHLNVNLRRPGVQAVFEQFFEQ